VIVKADSRGEPTVAVRTQQPLFGVTVSSTFRETVLATILANMLLFVAVTDVAQVAKVAAVEETGDRVDWSAVVLVKE